MRVKTQIKHNKILRMLAQLEKLPDCNVRLHATEMGKGLYEKLGFVSCGEIRQHQTRAVTTLPDVVIPAGLQLRPATLADHATLVTLDQHAKGMLRPARFDHMLQGEFLRLDTEAELQMAARLQSRGLPQVDAPATMVRGTPWTPQGMQAFGLMTQAMA